MSNVKTKIFDLARPITQSRNKYEWFATQYGLKNYRLITSGELLVRGKGLDIPIFVKEFVKNNNEVISYYWDPDKGVFDFYSTNNETESSYREKKSDKPNRNLSKENSERYKKKRESRNSKVREF